MPGRRACSGRTAVITGGGSGVGSATARTPMDGGATAFLAFEATYATGAELVADGGATQL
ncbi:hypothetical protein [Streptomyces sp. NPDC048225]|uniref:hypothetical protein n=1 Tax=Streptomyces sp. NPDC048225 TaxID=3365518 RepID=UPI00371EC1F7